MKIWHLISIIAVIFLGYMLWKNRAAIKAKTGL